MKLSLKFIPLCLLYSTLSQASQPDVAKPTIHVSSLKIEIPSSVHFDCRLAFSPNASISTPLEGTLLALLINSQKEIAQLKADKAAILEQHRVAAENRKLQDQALCAYLKKQTQNAISS